MKVKATQSCELLVTPETVACQASLSSEFSRQEYWSKLPFPFPWDLLDPGVKNLGLLHCMQILYPLSHEGRPILILHNNDLKELLVAYFPHTIYKYDTINYLKYMILQKLEMTFWSPKTYCVHFSHFMNVITMNTSLLQLRTVFKTVFLYNYSFICIRKTYKKGKIILY